MSVWEWGFLALTLLVIFIVAMAVSAWLYR